jgi:pyruvate dehydrogenase E2 component (dihydrolipoamide acetyltransferase)
MATTVIMPKQGQSVESCVIVSWKKRAGDHVKAGEIICEVETDKATFEVESPAEGTLLAIFHEVGSDVPVLEPIAAIGTPGEKVEALRAGSAAAAAAAAAAPAPTAVGAAAPKQAVPAAAPAAGAADGRIKASPRAKALASSLGVSLAGIAGTGPGGRIIVRDVPTSGAAGTRATASSGAPAAAAAARASQPAAPLAEGEVRELKVTGVRKLIAERMLASLQGTAQLTMNLTADARALQDLRKKFKESPESLGLREVTINDMVLFAVTRALTQHPDLNAVFVGDTIRQHASVHLGFAVDTPRGLMVPVIRNAHALSLREIAREAGRLIKGCREGGVRPEELSGGTFTVTNLGAFGIQSFTPVLNAPQVGIIGVDTIAPAPHIAADGSVSFVPHIGLSLTVNHQVVDGAPGARFLQTLAADIARFDLLLAQ